MCVLSLFACFLFFFKLLFKMFVIGDHLRPFPVVLYVHMYIFIYLFIYLSSIYSLHLLQELALIEGAYVVLYLINSSGLDRNSHRSSCDRVCCWRGLLFWDENCLWGKHQAPSDSHVSYEITSKVSRRTAFPEYQITNHRTQPDGTWWHPMAVTTGFLVYSLGMINF